MEIELTTCNPIPEAWAPDPGIPCIWEDCCWYMSELCSWDMPEVCASVNRDPKETYHMEKETCHSAKGRYWYTGIPEVCYCS